MGDAPAYQVDLRPAAGGGLLCGAYPGEWVVVMEGRILAHGRTFNEVAQAASESMPETRRERHPEPAPAPPTAPGPDTKASRPPQPDSPPPPRSADPEAT